VLFTSATFIDYLFGGCATSASSRACTLLQERYGYAPLVMVGDGATDAEARQPGGADVFIGYGGAVRRPAVAAAADWYVMSIQPLLDALH